MVREIAIQETFQHHTLARGLEGRSVIRLEGNWYFEQAAVAMQYLKVTDRVYVCPHKGQCFWIDLELPDRTERDVAWVYTIVKPNYEYIKDRIGFYGGQHGATRELRELAGTMG